jgi:hypothetical protein
MRYEERTRERSGITKNLKCVGGMLRVGPSNVQGLKSKMNTQIFYFT